MEAVKSQYAQIAEFISMVLGSSYCVAYYDVEDVPRMWATFSSGFSSPSEIALVSELVRAFLIRFQESPDMCAYKTILSKNSDFRHNLLLVRDQSEQPRGVMVLSYNQTCRAQLLTCIRSMLLVEPPQETPAHNGEGASSLPEMTAGNLPQIAIRLLREREIEPGRALSPDEKISILSDLNARSAFTIKGAVPIVASLLNASEATIYRYLSKLNRKNENDFWEPINLI